MGKILDFVMSFVLGAFVASIALLWYWLFQHPDETEVWTNNDTIRLEGGTSIPAGLDFTIEHWMPEGFVTLTLHVNVEGEALQKFDKRIESKRDLVIPVWVEI